MPTPPPKKKPTPPPRPQSPAKPPRPQKAVIAPVPSVIAAPAASGEVNLGVAVAATGDTSTVTARKAGGLRDMGMNVDPVWSAFEELSSI
jgi:hypothetical protein